MLSARFSDQPQRWAAAPAAFLGVVGLACLSPSPVVHQTVAWVWPPALFALVVWMFRRVRTAEATTHDYLVSDQADSATASQAIRDVVAAVRTSRPLPER